MISIFKSKKAVVALALVALLSASYFFYFQKDSYTADAPPSLEFGNSMYQGFISDGTYLSLTEQDLIAKNPDDFAYTVDFGVNMLYFTKDMTVSEILDSIYTDDLSARMVFAHFRDGEFNVFPKSPYKDVNVLSSTDVMDYIVPAYHGFFIIVDREVRMRGVKGMEDRFFHEGMDFNGLTSGWHLLAAHEIDSCVNRIKVVWSYKDGDFYKLDLIEQDFSDEGFLNWYYLSGDMNSCVSAGSDANEDGSYVDEEDEEDENPLPYSDELSNMTDEEKEEARENYISYSLNFRRDLDLKQNDLFQTKNSLADLKNIHLSFDKSSAVMASVLNIDKSNIKLEPTVVAPNTNTLNDIEIVDKKEFLQKEIITEGELFRQNIENYSDSISIQKEALRKAIDRFDLGYDEFMVFYDSFVETYDEFLVSGSEKGVNLDLFPELEEKYYLGTDKYYEVFDQADYAVRVSNRLNSLYNSESLVESGDIECVEQTMRLPYLYGFRQICSDGQWKTCDEFELSYDNQLACDDSSELSNSSGGLWVECNSDNKGVEVGSMICDGSSFVDMCEEDSVTLDKKFYCQDKLKVECRIDGQKSNNDNYLCLDKKWQLCEGAFDNKTAVNSRFFCYENAWLDATTLSQETEKGERFVSELSTWVKIPTEKEEIEENTEIEQEENKEVTETNIDNCDPLNVAYIKDGGANLCYYGSEYSCSENINYGEIKGDYICVDYINFAGHSFLADETIISRLPYIFDSNGEPTAVEPSVKWTLKDNIEHYKIKQITDSLLYVPEKIFGSTQAVGFYKCQANARFAVKTYLADSFICDQSRNLFVKCDSLVENREIQGRICVEVFEDKWTWVDVAPCPLENNACFEDGSVKNMAKSGEYCAYGEISADDHYICVDNKWAAHDKYANTEWAEKGVLHSPFDSQGKADGTMKDIGIDGKYFSAIELKGNTWYPCNYFNEGETVLYSNKNDRYTCNGDYWVKD